MIIHNKEQDISNIKRKVWRFTSRVNLSWVDLGTNHSCVTEKLQSYPIISSVYTFKYISTSILLKPAHQKMVWTSQVNPDYDPGRGREKGEGTLILIGGGCSLYLFGIKGRGF